MRRSCHSIELPHLPGALLNDIPGAPINLLRKAQEWRRWHAGLPSSISLPWVGHFLPQASGGDLVHDDNIAGVFHVVFAKPATDLSAA
jgi:hypothetical protein